MHVICQNGFEHHAAMNRSHCAAAVAEALAAISAGKPITTTDRPICPLCHECSDQGILGGRLQSGRGLVGAVGRVPPGAVFWP